MTAPGSPSAPTGIRALADLVGLTLTSPREGLARVLALRPSAEARWLALALVSILPVIEFMVVNLGIPDQALDPLSQVLRNPVAGTIFQGVTIIVMSAAVAGIGQRFGGTARYAEAMVVVIWIQLVMVFCQLVLMVLLLVSPPLAAIISLVATVIYLRLLTHGVALVNGFRNLPLVFGGIVVTFVMVVTVVTIALLSLGIVPDLTGGARNV